MSSEKSLSQATRETHAKKMTPSKFANIVMPSLPPDSRTDSPASQEVAQPVTKEAPVQPVAVEETPKPQPPVAAPVLAPSAAPKPERARKAASFSFEDIINTPVAGNEVYTKMVRVTDDHHELLRLLSFYYRKPMTTIMHNMIEQLKALYEKEQQKGGQNNA